MKQRSIVILVDHKVRDLMGATLIAHHVEARGLKCHLEPLEATFSCLAAHKPDLILFNHLNAAHLVRYSQRLKSLNVLTAVLSNEGISYNQESLNFNAGSHHKGSHIDLFFCWNQAHKNALEEQRPGGESTQLYVSGIPRFDLYFKPWSDQFAKERSKPSAKPKILVCTNFGAARYESQSEADKSRLFAQFAVLPLYKDYHETIAVSVRGRSRLLVFLEALADSGEFEILLRPHPREETSWYAEHLEAFSPAARKCITIDSSSVIASPMHGCDLEISCETCTTSMEAWMSGKPAVELVFERHRLHFHEDLACLNTLCDDPAQIVETVRRELADPEGHAKRFSEGRREHLAKWCSSPDGSSSERIAEILCDAVKNKEPMRPDFTLGERRKGMKLRLTNALNIRYCFSALLPLKARLMPKQYGTKWMGYRKIIRPSDVRTARRHLVEALRGNQSGE